MDEFKKYLFDHRDELDTEKPPRPQVWKHIQRKTQVAPKPVITLVAKWLVAAAILVAASILIYHLQHPEKVEPRLSAVDTPKTSNNPELTGRVNSSTGTASGQGSKGSATELPGDKTTKERTTVPDTRKPAKKDLAQTTKPVSPLKAIEDNYATIINYQLRKLEKTPIYTESPGYFHVFKKQWLDLERDEKKVKQDVRLYGLTDNVVYQLIQLYQQKLWLLKELQSEITNMNSRAKQHPDIQRTNPAYLKL
ncbi:hypothetical protein HB364_06500 [Pseudoflavitalea sp. X16]|uniref:hypothetical protein n=1 Tax=Paraflavitalea devenefica TaxID=2716334 RepID=UPI0014246306|nr:hypothetical protein [Paraflavitalea devenefica]NII24718.1 hypothetical protein [Paraflavitalea devenefica]